MTNRQRENQTIVTDMNRSRDAVESVGSCNSNFLFLSPSLSFFLLVFSFTLGAFVNKCLVTSVRLAIRPYVCIKIISFPTARIWVKYCMGSLYYRVLKKKLMFGKIQTKLVGTVYEKLREFMALSCCIFLSLWKASLRRICRENQLTIFSVKCSFFENISFTRLFYKKYSKAGQDEEIIMHT